ncbi:hypothetical protein FGU65_13760 [Methanoculleus sp. FWC-SCC1]|uniref:Uncharacterized protein n=1 Tax=Methanoculleus frigidifontis TaxID=2584085 RepID=A0ABT8MDG7_9EURY|nr:hypothetical protein [Methanoculleus sp. FWC-SCC1]
MQSILKTDFFHLSLPAAQFPEWCEKTSYIRKLADLKVFIEKAGLLGDKAAVVPAVERTG